VRSRIKKKKEYDWGRARWATNGYCEWASRKLPARSGGKQSSSKGPGGVT